MWAENFSSAESSEVVLEIILFFIIKACTLTLLSKEKLRGKGVGQIETRTRHVLYCSIFYIRICKKNTFRYFWNAIKMQLWVLIRKARVVDTNHEIKTWAFQNYETIENILFI